MHIHTFRLTYLNTDDSILDDSSTSKKANNFYLIHHQSSLIPIKNLLNKNLNSNIEFIQMDEQESILEIVDGAVTIVPKNKSPLTISDEEKFDEEEEEEEEEEKHSIEYEISNNYGKKKKKKPWFDFFQNPNMLNK